MAITEELVQTVAPETQIEPQISVGEAIEKLYTVEEFLALEWDNDDETVYELIGGRIVPKEKPGPSAVHSRIANKIGSRLEVFANEGETSLGQVFNGGACTLGRTDKDYVIPDVSFVAEGRMPKRPSGPIPVAPDLVVEINSPSDTVERIHNKIEAYRLNGVRLVWSIYPLGDYIIVHRLDTPKLLLLWLEDELDGEAVLPGFKLKVSALFQY